MQYEVHSKDFELCAKVCMTLILYLQGPNFILYPLSFSHKTTLLLCLDEIKAIICNGYGFT